MNKLSINLFLLIIFIVYFPIGIWAIFDSVLISNPNGKTRIARIGRLKIEKRPFLAIYWHNIFDKPSCIFLQQAETVRLVNSSEELISITSLKVGDEILGWSGEGSRHIGESISSKVEER